MTEMSEKQIFSTIPIPTGSIALDREMEIEQEENISPASAGTGEGGIPQQGFFGLLKGIVKANYKALPKRLLKDAIWLVPLAIIWVGLWSLNVITLMSLPGPLRPLASVVIFLTATYNGFIGKAAFVTVMSRTFVPMIKKIRRGEFASIKERYGRTASILRSVMAKSKRYSMKIILVSAGFGLIASNILTRNNKIDKYLICVLCAVALFDDLSKGQGSAVIRLVSTGLRDLPLLIGKSLKVTNQSVWLTVSGFAIGLVLAIVPGQFVNSFVSPMGFIFGAVLVIAGTVLHLTEGKHAENKQ